jgi:hypothetical protein
MPILAAMFTKGGLELNDDWNRIRLADHANTGSHSNDYHLSVYGRLVSATRGKKCNPYRHALQKEL